jgi:hypothetical protein
LWGGALGVSVLLAGAVALSSAEDAGRSAAPVPRSTTSSAVSAPVQGGGGVEPASGAPPLPPSPLESRPVLATVAKGPSPSAANAARSSLRAISTGPGEATLEVDGVPGTVRPGSRIGRDTVKSVSPGRLVLERPSAPGAPPGSSLVIVTFDEAGRAKTQVFWTSDPTLPTAPEVKRP